MVHGQLTGVYQLWSLLVPIIHVVAGPRASCDKVSPRWAFKKEKNYYLFIWLHWVLVESHRIFTAAHRTFCYGTGWSRYDTRAQLPLRMWDLSSMIRDWTCIPCVGERNLNHWAIREVPRKTLLICSWLCRHEQPWSQSSEPQSCPVNSWAIMCSYCLRPWNLGVAWYTAETT